MRPLAPRAHQIGAGVSWAHTGLRSKALEGLESKILMDYHGTQGRAKRKVPGGPGDLNAAGGPLALLSFPGPPGLLTLPRAPLTIHQTTFILQPGLELPSTRISSAHMGLRRLFKAS
jgi:hypothetical protein